MEIEKVFCPQHCMFLGELWGEQVFHVLVSRSALYAENWDKARVKELSQEYLHVPPCHEGGM